MVVDLPRPAPSLGRLLAAVAADPEAGPVGEWARRLMRGDRREAGAPRHKIAAADHLVPVRAGGG